MVIKSLTVAIECLYNIQGAGDVNITPELETNIREFFNNGINPQWFAISLGTVECAENMLEYSGKHKLIMASYVFDPVDRFGAVMRKMIEDHQRAPVVGGAFLRFTDQQVRLMREIYMFPQTELTAQDLINGNGSVKGGIEAMTILHNENLGVHRKTKSANNKYVSSFRKLSHEVVSSNALVGERIANLGLNLTEVLNHLATTERAEANLSNDVGRLTSNKRKSTTPPNKTSKRQSHQNQPTTSRTDLAEDNANVNHATTAISNGNNNQQISSPTDYNIRGNQQFSTTDSSLISSNSNNSTNSNTISVAFNQKSTPLNQGSTFPKVTAVQQLENKQAFERQALAASQAVAFAQTSIPTIQNVQAQILSSSRKPPHNSTTQILRPHDLNVAYHPTPKNSNINTSLTNNSGNGTIILGSDEEDEDLRLFLCIYLFFNNN
jgi:hypothetical protein